MIEEKKEHTGLLRLGLDLKSSVTFWQRAPLRISIAELLELAQSQSWYPQHSNARVKYLVTHLHRRFPESSRRVLRTWKPEESGQAPTVCHWHLQLSDPIYRDFTFQFLLSRWSTGSDEVEIDQVERWLERRGGNRRWSQSTLRRLASGLFSAATEAGMLGGSRSRRVLRKPQVSARSIEYLNELLAGLDEPVDPAPYLLTAYWGELEVKQARAKGLLR